MKFNELINEVNMNFETGYDVIKFLDSKKELKQYRNKEAEYDDTYFEIPMSIVKKVLKWTEKDVDKIQSKLENYEGSVRVYDNMLYVIGGA